LAPLTDHLLVVGKHRDKLARLERLGIKGCLLPDRPRDRAADIVVDCTGSDSGLATALELVRPRGTIVLKTTVAGVSTLALAPVVVDEVTIVGSRCGPFGRALDALAGGLVDVRSMIDDRFPLSEGVRALQRAAEPEVLKVLVAPD
jgi:threonine dehydrogenase-like Zn-dependent dehydrogenase